MSFPSAAAETKAILVVRLSARGDLVFASPLAGALRRSHPGARIAWVAEERAADVIRHNPHLDEVIVWERAKWRLLLRTGRWGALAREIVRFFGALRERRFDLAIDVQGLMRSGLMTWLSGAPERIGLGSREGSQLLMTRVVPRGGDDRRIASEYRYLAERLGLDCGDFALEIPRTAAEVTAAARMMGGGAVRRSASRKPAGGERGAGAAVERGVRTVAEADEGPVVVLCPFTTRPWKHWLEERWTTLIGRIREETGARVVLLGGPADRAAADRIVGGAPGNGAADVEMPGAGPGNGAAADRMPRGEPAPGVVDLVGRTTLGEAAAAVSACSVLVGVDTGLSHMAHAFGRPTVVLLGSNTPYLDPPDPRAAILHSGRPCSPCRGRLVCDGRIDCMRDLEVDDVMAAVAARLNGSAGPAGSRTDQTRSGTHSAGISADHARSPAEQTRIRSGPGSAP